MSGVTSTAAKAKESSLDKIIADAIFKVTGFPRVGNEHLTLNSELRTALMEYFGASEKNGGQISLYSWLAKTSKCGISSVEHAARELMDYYEGATPDVPADPRDAEIEDLKARLADAEQALRAQVKKKGPITAANGWTVQELTDFMTPGKLDEYRVGLTARVLGMAIRFASPSEALMFQIQRLQMLLPEEHRCHVQRHLDWHENGRPYEHVRPLLPSSNSTIVRSPQSIRESFERWCSNDTPVHFSIEVNDVEEYISPETKGAWIIWQAWMKFGSVDPTLLENLATLLDSFSKHGMRHEHDNGDKTKHSITCAMMASSLREIYSTLRTQVPK